TTIKNSPLSGGGSDAIFAKRMEIIPTGGNGAEFELFFDTYEEKKSVKPELQKLLQWLAVQNGKFSRVKVQFFWDRQGKKMDVDLNTGRVRFTMFLPDGTPCRATCTFSGKLHDNNDNALLNSLNTSPSTFFSTNINTQALQFMQSNGSGNAPLLQDPLLADHERAL